MATSAPWLWMVAPLALSALVWFPVTANYFFADDFLNLYQMRNYGLMRYLLTPNVGHVLVTRNMIFYLLWRLFGLHAGAYYWSSLLTHLVNVGLLFRVSHLVTRSPRLASFGAALWGASPVNAETLEWYAVYGHMLVGTLLLVILAQATRLADEGRQPSSGRLALWFALALMGATSFGTGLGVAVLLPAVLWLWLPAAVSRRRLWPLALLVVVVPAVYATLVRVYAAVWGDNDIFGLGVAWMSTNPAYFAILFERIIAWGFGALLTGFWSGPWLDLVTSRVLLAVFVAAVLTVMLQQRGLVAWRLTGCILILVGTYGVVAIGRAFLLETTVAGLVHTASRYQYAGTLVLTLMLCVLLASAAAAVPAGLRRWALVAWYALTVVCWARSTPMDHHDAARIQTNAALAAMQAAIERRPPGETVPIDNQYFLPVLLDPVIFPGWAGAFIIFHPANEVEGRQVRFIERNPAVREALRDGRRTGTLLVPPPPPAPPSRAPAQTPGTGGCPSPAEPPFLPPAARTVVPWARRYAATAARTAAHSTRRA
jgi:hypothetical protein